MVHCPSSENCRIAKCLAPYPTNHNHIQIPNFWMVPGTLNFFGKDFANKTGYKKQETTMFIVEYVGDRSDLLPKDNEINEVEFLKSDEVIERLTHNDTKEFFIKVLSKFKEV